MFDEILEVFEAELEKKSEKWLYDNYVPVPGTYILINIDEDFSLKDIMTIKKPDRKTGEIIIDNYELYELLRFLDKNSKLITMNKSVDTGKIIHSNNFYSFFIKKENIKNGKFTQKNIENYYSTLSNPEEKYQKNKKSRQMYENVEKKLGEVNTDMVARIKDWIEKNFLNFINYNNIDTESKDYIKMFFVYSDYEKTKNKIKIEGERYFLPNIFNSNDYNQTVNDETLGLHNSNMGLNSKKPFLENKTRPIPIPCAVSMEKALNLYLFMEYLSSQAAKRKYNIYIDLDNKTIISANDHVEIEPIESGIYLRIRQSKTETAIYSMERICEYRPNLKKPLLVKELLKLKDKSKKEYYSKYYGTKYKLYDIEKLVDEVLFNKYLISNYKTPADELPSNIDNTVRQHLILCREQLWNWFHNNDDTNVFDILNQSCKNLAYNNFINGHHDKFKNQFNLWFSLADYLDADEKRGENMSNVKELLTKHLSSNEDWEFENSDEYYYAVGQITYIFNNFSKALKKTLDMVRPIINTKDNKLLKERIVHLAKRYDYAFDMKYKKARILLSKILTYTTDAKVNDVMIMAGYVDDNLLYKSDKKKETINKNE